MGIEEVRKEIIDNAKNQARQILKEAEKEKQGILASAETRVNAIKERLDKEAEKSVEQYKIMMLAEATSIAKKQRLSLERDVINEVFEKSKEDILSISSKKREQHLTKIMAKAGKEFAKIYCSKKDIALMKKYRPSEADILGGLILENKEGDMRLDLSYETLLEKIKQDNVAEIAKILF